METKIAAIWARVSTEGQAELSLQSQIQRAKEKLENEGHIVPPDRILAVEWTSLDLFNCPEFQRLRQWVAREEIAALGILDRDRLNAIGLQRLTFLAECKEADTKVVICQGHPIMDEPEGQLIELALAIGKERSVRRASQGSKDGLHDRAVLKGLPTSHHRVYGYQWEGETLIPDAKREVVKLIYSMALQGETYESIIRELKKRGILSPGGKGEWCKPTISGILRNPIYGGKYYALKKEATQPATRRGNTYGNSSQRRLPFEQWKLLPEAEVVNPPVSWDEWIKLQDRLKRNQELAQRNGKADYLLRGFIYCDYHRGQQGQPRRYHGQPHHGSWRYMCPVGDGCPHPYINGPHIEKLVKFRTRLLFSLQPEEFYKRISTQGSRAEVEASLYRELSNLEGKRNKNINAKTRLEAQRCQGEYEDKDAQEVYRRLKLQYDTEAKWIEERKQAIIEQLGQLDREAEAVASLMEIGIRFIDRLHELTKAEWRELFTALNLEVHISEATGLEICYGIPLSRNTERIGDIVLKSPERG